MFQILFFFSRKWFSFLLWFFIIRSAVSFVCHTHMYRNMRRWFECLSLSRSWCVRSGCWLCRFIVAVDFGRWLFWLRRLLHFFFFRKELRCDVALWELSLFFGCTFILFTVVDTCLRSVWCIGKWYLPLRRAMPSIDACELDFPIVKV